MSNPFSPGTINYRRCESGYKPLDEECVEMTMFQLMTIISQLPSPWEYLQHRDRRDKYSILYHKAISSVYGTSPDRVYELTFVLTRSHETPNWTWEPTAPIKIISEYDSRRI